MRVNWSFLLKVLEKFGFSKAWCKWIKACISGAKFSVLINGSMDEYFKYSQGIRQGDPLSPALFILMAEAFSRAIIQSQQLELWKGIQFGGNDLVVTHFLFSDDTLLFGYENNNQAKHIKYLFDQYSLFSGQKISMVKSKIFFFNTTPPIVQRIKKILDFEEDKLPSTYLGVPFFMDNHKFSQWKSILDRIIARTMAQKVR